MKPIQTLLLFTFSAFFIAIFALTVTSRRDDITMKDAQCYSWEYTDDEQLTMCLTDHPEYWRSMDKYKAQDGCIEMPYKNAAFVADEDGYFVPELKTVMCTFDDQHMFIFNGMLSDTNASIEDGWSILLANDLEASEASEASQRRRLFSISTTARKLGSISGITSLTSLRTTLYNTKSTTQSTVSQQRNAQLADALRTRGTGTQTPYIMRRSDRNARNDGNTPKGLQTPFEEVSYGKVISSISREFSGTTATKYGNKITVSHPSGATMTGTVRTTWERPNFRTVGKTDYTAPTAHSVSISKGQATKFVNQISQLSN